MNRTSVKRRHERRKATSARRGIISGLVAATLAAGIAAAQQNPPAPVSTLKVTTEVVNVYAVVRTKHGELIPNLTKDDFELTEDGVPQEIKYFSRETDTPLTIGMMVDTSPSQGGVLSIEQQEADAFLRQVMRPKDLVFVIHFDVAVELLQDLTNNLTSLTNAINSTVINGGGVGVQPGPLPTSSGGATHLYDAIYLASNELLKNEVGRKVLILLTDGEDQGSQESLDSALAAAQKADVIIYSIAIEDRRFYGLAGMAFNGDSVLEKLSRETGGRMIKVNKMKNTQAAFQEIADELRTQYLLGYTPTNTKPDGGFRKIRVRTRDRDYKVQAREGYYPPSSP
jgi:VWFA-related protein